MKKHEILMGILFILATVSVITGSILWAVSSYKEYKNEKLVEEQNKPLVETWFDNPRNPVNICIAQGGIPQTSGWDGRLEECQFKPTNNKEKE